MVPLEALEFLHQNITVIEETDISKVLDILEEDFFTIKIKHPEEMVLSIFDDNLLRNTANWVSKHRGYHYAAVYYFPNLGKIGLAKLISDTGRVHRLRDYEAECIIDITNDKVVKSRYTVMTTPSVLTFRDVLTTTFKLTGKHKHLDKQ